MNIYEKLLEVRKTCDYLKKDNEGQKFKYVSSSQTIGALRGAMDEQKLLLVPNVTASRFHLKSGDQEQHYVELDMTFTWVDTEKPDARIICNWVGHGTDSGEKSIGKAVTYAEKTFLLKFFNIATDRDDPDAHQEELKEDLAKGKKERERFDMILVSIDNAANIDELKAIAIELKKETIDTKYVAKIKEVYKNKKTALEAGEGGIEL